MGLQNTAPKTDQEPTLRERGRAKRIARIRSAAEELFAARGYDDVSMSEVARLAEVGEATLFRYVNSKSDLLLMMIGERVAALLDDIERADALAPSGSGRDYLDRIYRIYESRASMYVSDPMNISAFMMVGLDDASSLSAQAISMGDRTLALVTRILEEGQQAGYISDAAHARTVALNCNGAHLHEISRSPVRKLSPETFPTRLRERLAAQLEPLLVVKARPKG
ncbi:hypothetical protein AU252_01095 [Pseudarthrobacter sulfonivorans]|uniref:HTH tetR-type domain-containing protein n=1 Tax=Pseudarthrobacter sulfonivorans TaxID=121292 RepID=A0A0U3Q3W6_9MICC|nr:TetR/AcrR family transcriptional regulator [Pseudarthrobacter sulfonivorans]ALV39930.1 hypothetical protein AU252_01095 [Pseudarthrobacter sulfonivorans]